MKKTINPFVFISILFHNYFQHSPSHTNFHSFHPSSLLRKPPTFPFLFPPCPFIILRHYISILQRRVFSLLFLCLPWPLITFRLSVFWPLWRGSPTGLYYLHLIR